MSRRSRFPSEGVSARISCWKAFYGGTTPEGGARTLKDLIEESAERVVIGCDKCERAGSYSRAGLLARHGMTKRLPDLLAELSADCSKRAGQGLDRCGAVFRFEVE